MISKSLKLKISADVSGLIKELEAFRYNPYHQIVSNRVEDTLGYYEQQQLRKKIAEVFTLKESDLGMTYNPFFEIGREQMIFDPNILQEAMIRKPWIKETKKEVPPMITLTITSIQPEVVNVLHAIGAYGLSVNAGKITLTLEEGPYKQFDTRGVIFTSDGRTLDPSFGVLSLRDNVHFLRHYEKVEHDGKEIDKHVIRRDAHYVVFPVGTTQASNWSGNEYTLPGGAVVVINTLGYLYIGSLPFKRGDAVIVDLQDEEIEGTYDTHIMAGESCFVDLESEGDGPKEYIKVRTSRVRHA